MAYIGQREDEWEAAQKKNAKKKANRESVRCQVCNKHLKNKESLVHHLRDVHSLRLAPPRQKKYKLEPIVKGDKNMRDTIIWSKPNCPYCDKAKQLLDASAIVYEERVITQGWTKQQLLNIVPAAKTVPQIFIHGEYVGGYDDLVKYYEDHNMNIGGTEL